MKIAINFLKIVYVATTTERENRKWRKGVVAAIHHRRARQVCTTNSPLDLADLGSVNSLDDDDDDNLDEEQGRKREQERL